LETKEALNAFSRVIGDFQTLYESSPQIIAADFHPDYASTEYAKRVGEFRGTQVERVQHHWAHVMSCMAENDLDPPALGVAWDGAGYGSDGTIWGGEFLFATDDGYRRAGHFRTFPLPGGGAAIKLPSQTATGLLYEVFGEKAFTGAERPLLREMLRKGIYCP